MESSEVNEEDDTAPFKNINVYELSTRESAVLSLDKDIPKIEKQFTFGNMLNSNPEYVEHKYTSM